jgi:hypothetical protein
MKMAGSLLQTPESHAASNFHFLLTGGGSWIFDENRHQTIWAASWEEMDELKQPTHYHRKMMVIVFFNGTWTTS